jgi:hypothetical protein
MGQLLLASTVTNLATIELSVPDVTDWIEFPQSWTAVNRKSGGGSLCNLPSTLGGFGQHGYGGDAYGINWSGGTPTATGSAVTDGIYASAPVAAAVGDGIQFTCVADTVPRIAVIHWGAFNTSCQVVISMSDGSAGSITHTPAATPGGSLDYTTTVLYQANSSGQTVNFNMTVTAANLVAGSNITLRAATIIALPASSKCLLGAGA